MAEVPTYQEIASDFEGQVRRFLKKLKFKSVDGGPAFKIGGHQIDAVGIHESTLLVIECVARSRPDLPLRAKIKSVRGIMIDVKKAIKKHPKFRDVKDTRFIVATNDRVTKKEDIELGKRRPQVSIWDGNFIEYYRALQRKIGQYAKFGMLAELDIHPTTKRELQVPCMKVRIYDRILYSFFAPPRDLLKFCYVARREMARESYYQRLVERRRILFIARDFLNRRGIFPNSVLLSFNKPPTFSSVTKTDILRKKKPDGTTGSPTHLVKRGSVEFGVLTFPEDYQSCWIIDGQHRLYGFAFARASVDQDISVVAFHKLPLDEQARYFLEINSNQKPVPPDLLWDLKGELMPNSSEGVISRVVKELNRKGSLRDHIYIPSEGVKKPGRKLLKFSGMCINIKRRKLNERQSEHMRLISDRNPIYRRNPDLLVQRLSAALADYFSVVNSSFSEDEKREFWLQNSGVSILIAIYECALRRVRAVPSVQELALYVDALAKTFREEHDDVRLLRLQSNSEGGRSELARDFVSRIATSLGDQDFMVPGAVSAFDKKIAQFEREFARYVVHRLASVTENWTRERIPPAIIDKLVQSYGKVPTDLSDYLTLGECNEILRIKNNWDLMKVAFVRGVRGFPSEDAFRIALEYVTEHRNALTHKRPLRPGYSDEAMRDAYFRKLSRCLMEATREGFSVEANRKTNSQTTANHGNP